MKIYQKLTEFFGIKSIGKLTDANFFSNFFFPSRRNRVEVSTLLLQKRYRESELAFACIKKIADVMNDARLFVEKRNSAGDWEEVTGHPLSSLFRFPNPHETGKQFRRKLIQSANISGICYIFLHRPRPLAPPSALSILNPSRVRVEVNHTDNTVKSYLYSDVVGRQFTLSPADVVVFRYADITDEFGGLAPLAVALKAVETEINQAEFLNTVLDNQGVLSGILSFEGNLSDEMLSERQKLWQSKYGKNGSQRGEVAAMDRRASYTPIASKISELENEVNTFINEAKICSTFGVPPVLVSAYVGLRWVNNRASAGEALRDFGQNKIAPELGEFVEWLTVFLLPLFEDINLITSERVRVNYDASTVAALQEDVDKVHQRARENAKSRIWTVDEARMATGKPALEADAGNVFLQPQNVLLISPDNRLIESDPDSPETTRGKESDDEPQKLFVVSKKKCDLKTYNYDGLTLARKPNEVEKLLDLKGMVETLETESQKTFKVLEKFRKVLINEALAKVEGLNETNISTLTLTSNPKQARKELLKILTSAYEIGRKQVLDDIQRQSAEKGLLVNKDFLDEDSEKRIENLSYSSIQKLINEIQSRVVTVFLSLTVQDIKENFFEILKTRIFGESLSFLNIFSRDVTNAAIQTGRTDEILESFEEGNEVEYSALLDKNTCGFCGKEDGKRANDPKKLKPVPNPNCEGGTKCRCFHVIVVV